MESIRSPEEVRARLEMDVANGRTVVLSTQELDDPSLREQLPQMLEELQRAQPPAAAGPKLHGYTMLGEIGQGGMSTVYLARQDALSRHVAVKIAPKWLGGGPRARERLVQEARAMARVTHPNIVVIHDIIDVDDTFAIAMEWVDGRTLASLLRSLPSEPGEQDMQILCAALGTDAARCGEFEQTTIRYFVRLIHDIALATQAVHEAGLLHLDVKPSNVLVRRDGTPLLADFGVVREISAELTQTRTFAGTPVYAAPEQLRRDDAKIGPRSDVYSLGVTLYEALARSQPLRALDLPGIVQCVEGGRMPRLSEKTAVTPDLENIVHKAIAPEPEHRYASAAEFADDLLAFLEHRPVKARPLTRGQRVRRWARNEPWQAALAITLAVMLPLLGGLGTYLALQLPALERLEQARRLEQANRLKQEVVQRWLVRESGGAGAIEQLERAMDLERGDTSLACLLVVANEQGWPALDAAIERNADRLQARVGLRLLAQKAAARRAFFDAGEVAQLRGSEDPADRYVLALDRAFRAVDDANHAALQEAQTAIEEAVLEHAPDPLLLGLMAWFAQRTGDTARREAAVRTMWQRWPDDAVVLGWASLAVEPWDFDEARRLLDAVLARTPDQLRGYELLAGALLRGGRFDEVEPVVRRAEQRGLPTGTLRAMPLSARLRQGDAAAAEAYLACFGPGELTAARELRALKVLGAERLSARVDEILADAAPTPEMLHSATTFVVDGDDRSDLLWERARALYPDRRFAVLWRAFDHFGRRDLESAAAVARMTLPNFQNVDMQSFLAARDLMRNREWPALLEYAEHWLRHGAARAEASYYAAIAALRLDDHALAAERLAVAVHAQPGNKSWYTDALLEDVWLRASPEAPKALRDVALANLRMAEFDRRNRRLRVPHDGPWTDLVRAELLFANGDADAALQRLERGLEPRRRREVHAPADYRARLERARERVLEQLRKR